MSYIKREPLLQYAKEIQGTLFGAPLIARAIEEAPEEDVIEVRHGEWLLPLTNEPWRIGYFCRCSVCNKINHGHTLSTPNFCENCGAKMNR